MSEWTNPVLCGNFIAVAKSTDDKNDDMKHSLISVILVAGVLAINGCAVQHGSEYSSQESRLERLRSPTTTKKDLYYNLGQPAMVSRLSEGVRWSYLGIISRPSAGSYIPLLNAITGGETSDITRVEVDIGLDGKVREVKKETSNLTLNLVFDFVDYDAMEGDRFATAEIDKVRQEMMDAGLPFDERALRFLLMKEYRIRHQLKKNAEKSASK